MASATTAHEMVIELTDPAAAVEVTRLVGGAGSAIQLVL